MTERAPTPDELQAMAYVDGELSPEARAAFEDRLRTERALAREVADLRSLDVLARQVAPPEPMDHEWERLERELLHGTGLPAGLLVSALGALGVLLWMVYRLLVSDLDPLAKLFFTMVVLGLGTVFLLVLRARLRTLDLDPYRHVKR